MTSEAISEHLILKILNAPVVIRVKVSFTLMTTGAFSQNVGKLFSKLKLITDNLLFIYAEKPLKTS